MSDTTILQDSLNTIITEQISGAANTVNIWMWIAFAELILIIFLLATTMKKNKNTSDNKKLKKDALSGEIDFGNILKSSFHAQQLYDELKIMCHPDRFPNDEEKNKVANQIFQEISKNRHNYNKLLELKEQAKQQLNII